MPRDYGEGVIFVIGGGGGGCRRKGRIMMNFPRLRRVRLVLLNLGEKLIPNTLISGMRSRKQIFIHTGKILLHIIIQAVFIFQQYSKLLFTNRSQ